MCQGIYSHVLLHVFSVARRMRLDSISLDEREYEDEGNLKHLLPFLLLLLLLLLLFYTLI